MAEKLTFDGCGINDAADPYAARLATFTERLRADEARARTLGMLLAAAPRMLAALELAESRLAKLERWDSVPRELQAVRDAIKIAKGEQET